MRAPVLSVAELNRATLARQLLLERASVGARDAVERLAGMQAQEPKHPFIGLWTRLEGFEEEALRRALHERAIVRATLMRSTLHLMSAADYAALRMALQPPMSVALRVLGARAEGLELERVLPAARELLRGRALAFDEIRARLQEQSPEVNDRALGYVTSCRRRHDVIYADHVVMPMSELKCPTVRYEPGGEAGIRTRTDPGSRTSAADVAEVVPAARPESERAIGSQRHARVSSFAGVTPRDRRRARSETGAVAGPSPNRAVFDPVPFGTNASRRAKRRLRRNVRGTKTGRCPPIIRWLRLTALARVGLGGASEGRGQRWQ